MKSFPVLDYRNLSDKELTERFRLDDNEAFREIYQRYDKPLYLYAYHKLGNKEEATDVIHDVFVWMLNNRKDLDLKTTLSGYLYKSVLNKIFNIFKRNKTIQKYADNGMQFIDVESTETDFRIREKDIRAMIEREIASMPPRMREIYELKSEHYMTTKQIADHLGIAESTVSTQLKRALRHLKVKLGVVVYLLFIVSGRF